jgi:hypothetical protein
VTTAVYRTERGTVFRIIETDDGGLKAEVLDSGTWVAGRIAMVGLRLSPATTQLTPKQVKLLPS